MTLYTYGKKTMNEKISFPIPALGMFEKELSQVKNYTFLNKLKT